ncbi:MAG: transcription elongation factor GreA [Culicoidibacterales bacterium]
MQTKTFQMTAEGKMQLEQELEYTIQTRRPEVIEKLQVARSFGDLSENSEYDAAKDEQAQVEARIVQLETMLRNAEIVEKTSSDVIGFGSTVEFVEAGEDDVEEVTIVGSAEADPLDGKISNDSPMAVALIGKTTGDQVEVALPNGTTLTIVIQAIK